MAEFSYTPTPIFGSTYTAPDFSQFLFTAPSINIGAIPSFNFTLPSFELPQFQIPNIVTDPFYYIPAIPDQYFDYDPQLAQIQADAFDLRIALEDAIMNYTYQIDLINAARTDANDTLQSIAGARTALESQRSQLEAYKTQLEQNKTALDAATADYQSKVSLLTADGQKLQIAQTQLSSATAQYNTAVAQYQADRQTLENLQPQIDSLNAQLAQTRSQLSVANSDLESAQAAVAAALADASSTEQERQILQSQVEALQETQTRLQVQVQVEEAGLETTRRIYSNLQTNIESGQTQLSSLQTQISGYENQIMTAEQSLAQLQLDIDTSQLNLDTVTAKYNSASAQAQSAELEYNTKQSALQDLESSISASTALYATSLAQLTAVNAQLASAQSQLGTATQDYQQTIAALQAAQSQLSQIGAGGGAGTGTSAPEVTTSLNRQGAEFMQTVSDAKESGLNLNGILKGVLGMMQALLMGLNGILGALQFFGRRDDRPSGQPPNILPTQRAWAGFPVIQGVPQWGNNLSYGLGLVVLTLLAAWAIKETSGEKKTLPNTRRRLQVGTR